MKISLFSYIFLAILNRKLVSNIDRLATAWLRMHSYVFDGINFKISPRETTMNRDLKPSEHRVCSEQTPQVTSRPALK